MTQVNKGLYITLEGIDNSGKSLQAKLLMEHLTKHGYKAILTKEPGGSKEIPEIRELLLHKQMGRMTELLLFAADRAQHIFEVVTPALEAGLIVVSDRGPDSTVAYQGFGRNNPLSTVYLINKLSSEGVVPDVTFLFDLDPEIALSRGSASDKFESEALLFKQEVRKGYLVQAQSNPDRIFTIEASGEVEVITQMVIKRVMVLISEQVR